MLEIKPITAENVNELSLVATKAYFDNYRHLWYDFGEWYADKSFNINQLYEELSDVNNKFFLAIYDKNAIGFLKLRPDNQLPDVAEDGFEIERIYLTKAAQGLGVGRTLMTFADDLANQQNKDYIWLKTMDTGSAKDFYQHLGYQICGTHLLDYPLMKEELRGMLVMKKSLK